MIENYNSKYIYVHDTRKKNNTKRNNCFVVNTRKIIMKRLNEYKMILSKTIKYIKRKKNWYCCLMFKRKMFRTLKLKKKKKLNSFLDIYLISHRRIFLFFCNWSTYIKIVTFKTSHKTCDFRGSLNTC